MDVAAWVVQVLLALAFGMAGFMKLTQPREKLAVNMKWVDDFAPNIVKTIGGLEILGAVGLIVPALTKILPVLTPLAAVGLVLTMAGASLTHLRRKEYPMIVVNLVLLALAAFVAYVRFSVAPIV
ncbi:MAG: DoxX family protein [Anaerolineae bacterium]